FRARGVVPPHTCVDGGPFVVRRAGLPYIRMGEYAMVAVKPAIWSPYKRVERFVCILVAPAVEQYLGLASWFVCRRINWDIHQVRCSTNPQATESDFDTANHIKPFDKYLPAIERTVTVGIFKNQNPVVSLPFWRTDGIRVCFDHPKPSPIVLCKGNRTYDVRLGCSQSHLKSFRDIHYLGCLFTRKARVRHDIARRENDHVIRAQFMDMGGALVMELVINELNV